MIASTVNYPSVVPAILFVCDLAGKHVVSEEMIHFTAGKGTLETVSGFEPAFKAEVVQGGDWLSMNADGKHARIDARVIAQTDEGDTINLPYNGIVRINDGVMAIMNTEPTAKTIPFGAMTTSHFFQSGSEKLKALESMVFVGNGRMIVNEETKNVQIEYRISRVIPAEGME